MPCPHCQNGFLDNRFGQDVECVGGILIDIDEYHEGWKRDVCYPVAPCHPDFAKQTAEPDFSTSLADISKRLGGQS